MYLQIKHIAAICTQNSIFWQTATSNSQSNKNSVTNANDNVYQ